MSPAGRLRPAAALVALWLLAFTLACRLSARPTAGRLPGDSVLGRVLGVSRAAFAERFYLQADAYFHRGVEHERRAAFTNRLFQRWSSALRPSGHVHTEGYSASEIIPWLRVATRTDPRNVEAFLTMAYWLTRVGRSEAAEQVLREAQRLNPGDYRFLAERGRLALRERNLDRAAALTEAALRVWPRPLEAGDDDARLERARLLSLRGILHEVDGRIEEALPIFREALRESPENRFLARHVEQLERGETVVADPQVLLDRLFPVEHVCDREDHDHHHDHDHDEDHHHEP